MTIQWSDRWREEVPPGEAQMWAEFAEQIAAVARAASVRTGRPLDRVFHTKQHVGVRATLTVRPSLAHPLASGVFARAATYPCLVRFSSGAVRPQADGILDVRGVALKLLGVTGARLDGGADTTQDFLFVTTPAVPTDNPREFLALAQASVGGPLFLPLRLVKKIGLLRAASVLGRLALTPQPRSLAAATFYTAVPLQLGPAAAKLALRPHAPSTDARAGSSLRDDLVARLRQGPVSFTLAAQLFTDEHRTPIERAAIEWQQRHAPFHDVADLHIPSCDPDSTDGQALAERLHHHGFDPWQGIVDHRPLGATQRGRRAAYAHSRTQRGAAPEPRA